MIQKNKTFKENKNYNKIIFKLTLLENLLFNKLIISKLNKKFYKQSFNNYTINKIKIK